MHLPQVSGRVLDDCKECPMRRVWICFLALCVLIGFAIVTIPKALQARAESRMRKAIDENQPESLVTIHALVSQGQDIRTTGSQGATIAMVAAMWNDAALLKAALEGGVDPNAADRDYGNTALFSAMSG
jgi:hypothetical protein